MLIISLTLLNASCGIIDEDKDVYFGDYETSVLFNKLDQEIECHEPKFNEMVCVDVETLSKLRKEYKRLKRKASE